MKTQDLALQRSFLQKVILDDPNYKNYYALRKLFADYLTKLNVPFYDTCCPTASTPDSFPIRYFDGNIQYFDGDEWVTISVGVTTQMSVTQDGSGVKLVNDEAAPGNYQVYSTNSAGVRGWNDGVFGSGTAPAGTTKYYPVWDGTNTLGNGVAVESNGSGTGASFFIDDVIKGVTTTNWGLLVVRNAYPGDASGNILPQIFVDTTSNSATPKFALRLSASAMPAGSTISSWIGRSPSTRNCYIQTFFYNASGSTGNYVEDQFYAVTNVSRKYASGNTTFGVAADNGFKVEIGGTSRITQKLTLGTAGGTTGIMDFVGTTSGVVTLQAAAAAGTYTLTLPTDDGNSGEVLQTNGSGVLSWAPMASGTTSSTYTPTLTNSTNVSASTAYVTNYYQIGNVVTVAGRVSITPTAGGWTQTIMRMSVPVGTAFTSNEEGGGTANAINIQGNNGNAAGIRARALGGDMEFVWLANDTAAHDFFFTFSYQVIIP